jgi:hypothetical protein
VVEEGGVVTHIAVVELYADRRSRLEAVRLWRAACSCGWKGDPYRGNRGKEWAQRDGMAHMREFNDRRVPA